MNTYEISQWSLYAFAIILFYLSTEFGFRLGRRDGNKLGKPAVPHIATIEAALLGLLALLLGFAFSMSMNRYDSRREIVLDEANNLQTTFLRSQLLTTTNRDKIANLLRDYVDSRIAFLEAGKSRELALKALDWTANIQELLWKEAIAATKQNTDPVTTGYFIDSLNGLFDDHAKRINAMESHVPEVIIILLYFVAAMTLAITGYSSGFSDVRLLLPRSILIILVATTLVVIVDLDRPRRGFITINESLMRSLKNDLHKKLGELPN